MKPYPSIPDPTPNNSNVFECLSAIKQTLEIVIGTRKPPLTPHARLFRNAIEPGAANSTVKITELRDGDLWILPGTPAKMSYWDPAKSVWSPIA